MTRFIAKQFHWDCSFLTYSPVGLDLSDIARDGDGHSLRSADRRVLIKGASTIVPSYFIARFKYHPNGERRRWISFLIHHFTVEEFFAARSVAGSTPLSVMMSKGYK